MNETPGGKPWLVKVIESTERVIYYGAALFLLVTIGMVFYDAGAGLLNVVETGPLDTAIEVLDKILLIFIFAELLSTIVTIVRENEVRAEPFLLVGLIAVVRRILAVTASIEQSLGTPQFNNLLYELGVLTALVLALAGALHFTRQVERSDGTSES
ncbi:MAG: phosphate-starvation-inducible PsiE family protein [Rubrobacteraceae bacterium]